MKYFSTNFYAFTALLISSIAISQPVAQDAPAPNYIASRTVNLMDNPNNYTGSPYYNSKFLKGSILKNGKVIAFNQDLRFNASKEEFEIKNPFNKESNIVNTVLRSTDIEIKIGQTDFEFITSPENNLRGYFIVLFKGDKNSLYKKISKKYIPSRKATNSMGKDAAAMYRETETLYLVDAQGIFIELPSSNGGKLKAFGDLKQEVKTYAKENKLKLKKEKDLIKVVSYVNSK